MKTSQFRYFAFKENYKFILSVLFLGLVVSSLMVGYYKSIHQLILDSEILNQKMRARVLIEKVENYAVVVNQLSHSLQIHFTNSKSSSKEIEQFLIETVKASPMNLIYGVGVWYQPYQYDKTKKLVSSYVHRQINDSSKVVVTDEWNTEAYNYPEQDWYQKGFLEPEQGVYVEPYFDADQIYMTKSTAFFDAQKKIKGIISVDMVLPQLQSLIDELNKNDQEIIYIQSRGGYLLAHPSKNIFLDKIKNLKNKSLIDFKISDLKKEISQKEKAEDILTYSEVISKLDWTVTVESQKNFILKDSIRLFKIISLGICFLWVCLFSAIYFYIKSKKTKQENDKKTAEQQVRLLSSSRLATLGEFSSGVAHEINNPLGIIYGKTDLLIGKIEKNLIDLSSVSAELQKIKLNADRIAKIVRGLKTFSRDGHGDPFSKVLLKDLFIDTFSISSERLKSKNIKFDIIGFDEVMINCRPTQISQVLLNLLSNSIDAIELRPKPWILIQVKVEQDVQILITDSGLGISKSHAEKIMDPFYTTKEAGKGTGLGLSISESIIKEHKGSLQYNRASANTQFIIRLPKV